MTLSNYNNYACFNYEQNVSENDEYTLGDVVINEENQIGVIIQIHNTEEFRTDMFGNSDTDQVRLATQWEIDTYRPNIINEDKFENKSK
jgi:hypothetical protein